MKFGLIVIGDEILSGMRQDRHMAQTITLLERHAHHLVWCCVIGDEPQRIIDTLRKSREEGVAVFCCGGIGATPDDYTRQCAALAFGLPLERHPGALEEIEKQFGEAAHPKRVLMADLPQGAELIPNPVNRVPGFSLGDFHFLPGFPEMANPMMEWVLTRYRGAEDSAVVRQILRVISAHESDFIDLMHDLMAGGLKVASLPHLARPIGYVEFILSGEPARVRWGLELLQQKAVSLGLQSEIRD